MKGVCRLLVSVVLLFFVSSVFATPEFFTVSSQSVLVGVSKNFATDGFVYSNDSSNITSITATISGNGVSGQSIPSTGNFNGLSLSASLAGSFSFSYSGATGLSNGSYTITVTAVDGSGTASTNFTLVVSGATSAPNISAPSTHTFTSGSSGSYVVSINGVSGVAISSIDQVRLTEPDSNTVNLSTNTLPPATHKGFYYTITGLGTSSATLTVHYKGTLIAAGAYQVFVVANSSGATNNGTTNITLNHTGLPVINVPDPLPTVVSGTANTSMTGGTVEAPASPDHSAHLTSITVTLTSPSGSASDLGITESSASSNQGFYYSTSSSVSGSISQTITLKYDGTTTDSAGTYQITITALGTGDTDSASQTYNLVVSHTGAPVITVPSDSSVTIGTMSSNIAAGSVDYAEGTNQHSTTLSIKESDEDDANYVTIPACNATEKGFCYNSSGAGDTATFTLNYNGSIINVTNYTVKIVASDSGDGVDAESSFQIAVAHQSGAPTVTLSQALTDNSDTLNLTNGTELTATTVATVSVPSHGTLDTDVSVTATGNISGLTITKPLSGSTGGNVTVAYDPSGNNIIPDGDQTIKIAATGVNGESTSRTFTLNVAHQSGAPTVTLSQALTDNSDTLNLTNGTELTATTVATVSVPVMAHWIPT